MVGGKVIIITGASSGIGAEMAKLFAEKGAIVVLLARSLEKMESLSTLIKGKFDYFSLDVRNNNQVVETINLVLTKYGKIDILINNAGLAYFDLVLDAKIEDIEEMTDVNYLGMVRCTKAVLPNMVKERNGHIINLASVAGKIATPKAGAYSASKFAVIGFSDALRQEVASHNILVSSINPGPIDTPFFDRADPSGNYVKNVRKMMLSSEEVALAVYNVIIHKKKEITIPTIAHIGTKLFQIFPGIFQILVGKYLNQK